MTRSLITPKLQKSKFSFGHGKIYRIFWSAAVYEFPRFGRGMHQVYILCFTKGRFFNPRAISNFSQWTSHEVKDLGKVLNSGILGWGRRTYTWRTKSSQFDISFVSQACSRHIEETLSATGINRLRSLRSCYMIWDKLSTIKGGVMISSEIRKQWKRGEARMLTYRSASINQLLVSSLAFRILTTCIH